MLDSDRDVIEAIDPSLIARTTIIIHHRTGPWPKHLIADLNDIRGLIQEQGYSPKKIELHLPRKIVDQINIIQADISHRSKNLVLKEILGMKVVIEDTDSENVTALVKEPTNIDPNISYIPIKVNLFP